MRIIIATVQVPFVSGGAEALAQGLKAALIAHGHEAEIVAFPFNPAVPERIPEQMLACRLSGPPESSQVTTAFEESIASSAM